jgi:hypothetical protein
MTTAQQLRNDADTLIETAEDLQRLVDTIQTRIEKAYTDATALLERDDRC